MIKKGTGLLLLFLLVSLPGCGRRKKERGEYGRGRAMAQKSDDFKSVNMALANDKDLEVDEATKQFFMDEISQFVNVDDFDLQEAIKKDEFAWQAAGDQGQLETVYFGFNKNKADKTERAKVDRNVDKAKKMLAEGADVKLVIEGHACASAGSDAYNMALSQQRAAGVKSDLVAAGIPFDKVTSVGRGNEMLVVKEGSREEQAPNRRVEMHIIHS